MESSDNISSYAITPSEPKKPMTEDELLAAMDELRQAISNFSLTGPGMSGNHQDGFMYNP